MPKTHSFKLVLLGESAVGKSSLVLRFVKDEYSDYRESTIGLDDETTVKFEIWDTAGQERYRSLAPIYFRNSAAAVVVYDITQGPEATFEKAKQWVTTLHRQADPGIVIILVGNKLDLVVADPSLRRTSKEEAEQWAKEQGLLFLEASAKDGTNVDEIFMQIARKLPLSTQQSRDPAAAKGKGVKLANNGPASASACQC